MADKPLGAENAPLLNKLRREVLSKDPARAVSAFMALARLSQSADDAGLLTNALITNPYHKKNRDDLESELERFILRIDACGEDGYRAMLRQFFEKSRVEHFSSYRGPVLGIAMRLRPERIPELIGRCLDDNPLMIPQFVSFTKFDPMASFLEKALKDLPELRNGVFGKMKRMAKERGSFPMQLFAAFGDEGRDYLADMYRNDENLAEWALKGLCRCSGENVLEIGLETGTWDILANHSYERRARERLVEFLDDEMHMDRTLELLAEADDPLLADSVLGRKGSIIGHLSSKVYNPEPGMMQVDIMLDISGTLMNLVFICSGKAKGTLEELSASRRSELRGPAFAALGMLGEGAALQKAFKGERSKWSKFFISLGMMACGDEAAFANGASHAQEVLDAMKESLTKEHLRSFLSVWLRGTGLRAACRGLWSAHPETRSAAALAIQDGIKNAEGTNALTSIGAMIREAAAAGASPHHHEAKSTAARLLAEINRRRNELLSQEFEVKADALPAPAKKGPEGGVYRTGPSARRNLAK